MTDGIYQEINFVNERLPSAVLGLELGEHGNELRLYDPKTSQWLQTPPERAENAEIRAENAETRAQEEASARRNAETRAENAEAALAKALAALERLKAEENN